MLIKTQLHMQKIILRQAFQRDTQKIAMFFFIAIQEFLKPDLCLEIGAHEASFSRLMRANYPAMPFIVACEANPKVYTHMKSTIDFSKEKIVFLNKAVANIDGEVSFTILDENEGLSGRSSLLDRDYSTEDTVQTEKIVVEAVRGDTLVSKFTAQRVALWVDVEGAQHIVLEGLRNSLSEHAITSIFIELEDRRFWDEQNLEHEILDLLLDYGYIPLLCDEEYYNQHNVILIHQDSLTEDFFVLMRHAYSRAVEAVADLPRESNEGSSS